MSGYNLGSAEGSIVINYDGTAAQRAQDDIQGIGDSAGSVEPKLQSAANKAGAVGLAIAAGFGLAVKSAADFEQRMSAVEAVSGATAAEMDVLRQKALDIGKDTAFSATEGANAIEELVKAGISVPDVMNGAADATVALAAAGEIALPEAAAIASNALNQFQLEARQLPKVADLIAGAANASAIDVSEFGQSMSQVGAVAQLAGLDFEDTATAIALLGNSGIKGSDAGTSLKSMLSNLTPETEKANEAFMNLGLTAEDGSSKFYDAEGNMRSLSEVAELLQNGLEGMSDAEKNSNLEAIFGSDGIRAASILGREGAAGVDQLNAALNKTTAADVAATRMDNLAGKFEEFKGSLETLGIVVGSMLLPALTKIVEFMTSMLDVFLNLPVGVQALIAGFIGLVGASLLAFAAFVKLYYFLVAAKAAFIAIRAAAVPAWLAALGPIALVVAAVALVVGILALCYKKFEGFRNVVDKVAGVIKDGLIAAFNRFKEAAAPALERVRSVFEDKLLPALIKAKDTIAASLGPAFKTIADAVMNDLLPALKPLLPVFGFLAKVIGGVIIGAIYAFAIALGAIAKAVAFVAPHIARFITGAAAAFSGFIGIISGIINTLVGLFTGDFSKMWDGIKQIFAGGIQAVTAILGTILAPIMGPIRAVGAAIAGFFTGIWNTVKSVVTAGIMFVTGIIQGGLAILGSIWNAFWGTFGGLIKAVWGLIVAIIRLGWTVVKGLFLLNLKLILAIVRPIWTAIVTVIRTAWNIIKTVVRAGINFVKNIINTAWNAIRTVTSAVWNGIMSVIRAVWARIGGTVMGAVNRVKAVLSAAWSAIRGAISRAWNGFVDVVGGAVTKLVAKVAGIKDKVLGALGNAASWLYQKGRDIVQGLIDGITSMINTVKDKINELTSLIADHLPGSPVKTGPLKVLNQGYAGKKIVEMLTDGMTADTRVSMQGVLSSVVGLPALEADLGRAADAGRPLESVGAPGGAGASRSRSAASSGPARSRLVAGKFDFERGWFEGIAEDVYNDRDDYQGGGRGRPR